MASRFASVLTGVFVALSVFAQQPPPPLPPAVGNAVLLATNSIQVDRDTVVTRGDLVVNNAGGRLTIDQNFRLPAGFALKADSVSIARGSAVVGDIFYNVLHDDGLSTGHLVTPLALPVIGTLPSMIDRASGTQSVSLSNGEVRVVGTGDFAALTLGKNATLRLPGGPYTFASISGGQGASIIFDGPAEVVVNGNITLGQSTTIAAGPGVTTKHKMIFSKGAISIGKDSTIAATLFAPNGLIDAGQTLSLTGSFVARDIHVARSSTLNLRSGFRNLPPVANSQSVNVPGTNPVVITLTGSDPDLDPLHFDIGVAPTNGTLGPVVQAGPTSAVVVYTPRFSDPPDVFTFRVTDSEGFFANGTVTINEGIELPGPPTTIIARDDIFDAPPGRPSIIPLNAIAPQGVQVTLSIVSGPANGSLGPLTQPTLNPPHSGSVVYAPNPGFVGDDQLQFQACGTIESQEVCAVGTIRIAVKGFEGGEQAPDFSVDATSGMPSAITLAPSGAPPAQYRVLSLPDTGTLTDSSGVPITSVPYVLPSPIVLYQSPAGFTGPTSFTYSASNQQGSDSGTVTINVVAAPGSEGNGELAPDLSASTTSGTPVGISLTGGATSTLQYSVLSLPQDGTLTDGNGVPITSVPYVLPSPTVTYQSSGGFTGTMRFTYGATDGRGSDTGTITVTVNAPDNGRG